MDPQLLSEIIQGEAGSMGPVGMTAVALSLHCRIWQHGHNMDRIAREFYGRDEPGPTAELLAQLVLDNELPDNDYYWCMGHGPDVVEQKMKRGEWILMNYDGTVGLHLYSIDNVPYESEAIQERKLDR